jgi:hypothetical protein
VTGRVGREADVLLGIIRLDIRRIRLFVSEFRDSQNISIESLTLEPSSATSQARIEKFAKWLTDISGLGGLDPDTPPEALAPYIRWAQEVRRDFSDILQAAFAARTGTLPHWASIIFKLGRYGVASRALVQLALEVPSLFSPMVVEAVPAPPKVPFSGQGRPLEDVLKRVVGGREAEYSGRLARIWGSENPEAQFKAACPTLLAVHAESQLACFYDNNPQCMPLFRFIGVSKKSCYLCLKFLSLYPGSFSVSSSHQKLYVSWTLPPTVDHRVYLRYKDISGQMTGVMEAATRQDLERRLGAPRRPDPAESSAGVSLTGLTEHSAENGFTSSIVRSGRTMKLKRKDSATKSTLYPSSVCQMQSTEGAEISRRSATNLTEPSTGKAVPVSAPFSDIVIHFTRDNNTARQDIIRMSDVSDQSSQLPSWAQLINILKAGGMFGLAFMEGSEYVVIDG